MEALKKNRKVTRSAVTRGANDVLELLKAASVDVDALSATWDTLWDRHSELKAIDAAIYDSLLKADEEEGVLIAEVEEADTYNKKVLGLKRRCHRWLNEDRGSENATSATDREGASNTRGRRKFKLPTIEFKRFDGNIRDWLSFWGQFKKVHEDDTIDEYDKIEYLVQATIPGSRARQLVESFPAMRENYEKIIKGLEDRFGRADLQIEVYVRELLNLIIVKTTSRHKIDIASLYDRIETQLRALDTLGITSEKCAAILFPLIESCLPEELMRVWQRTASVANAQASDTVLSVENRLEHLLKFLSAEVENELRINLASEGFGLRRHLAEVEDNKIGKRVSSKQGQNVATAAGLVNAEIGKCIFCEGTHGSETCFKAQSWSLDQKLKAAQQKKTCFRCLKSGHISRKCNSRLKCVLCGKQHVVLICPDLPAHKKSSIPEKETSPAVEIHSKDQVLSNHTNQHVFLQTLIVNLKTKNGMRKIQALFDSGSQRSYLLRQTAQLLGYGSKRREKVLHGLFGGSQMMQIHNCYEVTISKAEESGFTFEVLDQEMICQSISSIENGPWCEELQSLNLDVNQESVSGPIELLIGADVAGHIYTGRRHVLQCGLVAFETIFGWTLMGKVRTDSPSNNLTLSCLSRDVSLTELWTLETLGIKDPIEQKNRQERAQAALDFFSETIKVNEEGRYEVRLPWLTDHSELPSNINVAEKRLEFTLKKLQEMQMLEAYDKVFREWEDEGVIEEVEQDNGRSGHYLPHRPVIKPNSTTKIRPVFDASTRERSGPSLNNCLEKGVNMIELIPSVIIRFRELKFGIIADIKKAFLQISLHEPDREFLKFLWVDTHQRRKVYRHKRVVFGVNSSPFLLGATIDFHLRQCLEKCQQPDAVYSAETVTRLAKSFYVDNCVTSVSNPEDVTQFVSEATRIMSEGKFELRGWETSGASSQGLESTPVLGLNWNFAKDVLMLNMDSLQLALDSEKVITKRVILSIVQRLFDPLGLTSPVTLKPKLWLQKLWKSQITWDQAVDEQTEKTFRAWVTELSCLKDIEIPRWIGFMKAVDQSWSLHTFCDASGEAFSAVVFLRIIQKDQIEVHLLAAKARVAPLETKKRRITIPRMELLAATIGARLYSNVRQNLRFEKGESYFWSDSSTVISWIRRQEPWTTFVHNRVAEIRTLTASESWRHIPGRYNPADLSSRGCTPNQLMESKWWEGPEWLRKLEVSWPRRDSEECNEEEVAEERKKSIAISMTNANLYEEWHLGYFSKYSKIIRMIGWVLRLTYNLKNPNVRRMGPLSGEEVDSAEKFVFQLVQRESFTEANNSKLSTLGVFRDQDGLIRVRSRVSNRRDSEDFRYPIVLPAKHEIVDKLVFQYHELSCHVGAQGLLSLLREKYWIVGGRRAVKVIISRCVICKRQTSKHFSVDSPPLVLDRVRDAVPFEVIGVDFTGPLYLKNGDKAWVCLFTCAVYRAVHVELVTALSTSAFLQAFRRFVARRGRPRTAYSDNGTNFVGAENAFKRLDWNEIVEYSSVQRISWKFNPPNAPWWGGFWERLIGVLKTLLRKILGRASLDFEELSTVLCDCESVVNARPLCYVSNDPHDLIVLTPAMFLREQAQAELPDCDASDQVSLSRKMKYIQRLRDDLRRRFRAEYLGQLKFWTRSKSNRPVKIGEVVLVGNDVDKRVNWPLGRVIELIPGKDRQVRVVRIETTKGQLLRPVQRLYPLEVIEEVNGRDLSLEKQKEKASKELDSVSVPRGNKVERDRESAGVKSIDNDTKSRVPESRVVFTRSGRRSRRPSMFC